MKITRRKLLALALVAAGGLGVWWFLRRRRRLGFTPTQGEVHAARAWLGRHRALDAHAHPGRTFVRDARGLSLPLRAYAALGTFEEETVRDMLLGGVGAAVFAAVADFPVLGISRSGLRAVREFEPGEAFSSYRRQVANLRRLAERGLVRIVEKPEEAGQSDVQRPGMILGVEGGDFLEGRAERLEEAYRDGIRVLTLVHYRTNELGDIQTEEPRHGGLTAVGREVVREMNRLGIVIDVAHGSEATVRGVLDISSKPVLASHTHIHRESTPPRSFPKNRFVSLDLARAVAEAGGVVGAWPAGIGISTLAEFADRIAELVDAVGAEHVCLGTDMDANYRAVLSSYADLPFLVVALGRRGFGETELEKILRGNLLRLLEAVWRP
ncbi:MAG: hypothetical protein KatS3mg076_0880 [Candidatus Binatia bacterium]|nr:MAG: hypothetical protein KatS3mg076_0880 [Candidatus Binatia bacterium]